MIVWLLAIPITLATSGAFVFGIGLFAKWMSKPDDIQGYVNGRPYRLDNEGTPIYGYQPRLDPEDVLMPLPGLTMQEAGDNLVRVFAPIARYYPDSDTVEYAPYVKQEFEQPEVQS